MFFLSDDELGFLQKKSLMIRMGGLGSAVSEVLTEAGLPAQLVRIGIPDEYSILGPPTHLYSHYGIDSEGIAKRVKEALKVEQGGR